MQIPKSIGIATVAISLFMLLLLLTAGGCSASDGRNSESAITPVTWSTPTPIIVIQPSSNGAMVRANVHGTGVYVTSGVRQLTGLKWKFKPADVGSNTTAAIQDSVVYFGHDGVLYAVDARTGTEKWNYKLADNPGTSAPAVAGGIVYVGGWEGLYALSVDTGEVKWTFGLESGLDDRYFDDPVIDSGTIYFGSWNHFYALDSETGKEKWSLKLDSVTRSVPTVYEGTIYIGTFSPDIHKSGYLYALDSKTGEEKWKLKATGGGVGGAVAVTDCVAYVSTNEDGLLALDASSGQEKWRYNPGSGLAAAPAAAYGMVYVIDAGNLYAVDAQTGKEKWRLKADGGLYSDPVIADGIVYFTDTKGSIGQLFGGQPDGSLHAVDAKSGQELWKFSAPGITSRAPAISEGTCYFGSEEGTFYAVK